MTVWKEHALELCDKEHIFEIVSSNASVKESHIWHRHICRMGILMQYLYIGSCCDSLCR